MTVGDSKPLFLGDCRDKASPIVVAMDCVEQHYLAADGDVVLTLQSRE